MNFVRSNPFAAILVVAFAGAAVWGIWTMRITAIEMAQDVAGEIAATAEDALTDADLEWEEATSKVDQAVRFAQRERGDRWTITTDYDSAGSARVVTVEVRFRRLFAGASETVVVDAA